MEKGLQMIGQLLGKTSINALTINWGTNSGAGIGMNMEWVTLTKVDF